MDVAVIGGGPAGMTAALLLARAGHRVTLYEREARLGGLWASRLDEDGRFASDNSCKVYQESYVTAPALFRLIGTDWRRHFHRRYDLTSDWLRPFVQDSGVTDLARLAWGWVQHRLGRGQGHRVSVEQALEPLSARCTAWMRATALGGIAGTLRMTMWEFFHRIGSNVGAILASEQGPLYWNAQPPSAPGGFLEVWTSALENAGVRIRCGVSVRGLRRGPVVETARGDHSVEAVLLAVPPPAVARLLAGSDFADGFGTDEASLLDLLQRSVYEHAGVAWFFDQPLPSDLPLGGHNVRQGWHPILVQHDQYGPHLPAGCRSVVVGSVALDTSFRHHRLGTLASEHSLEELAEILWEDEMRRDPSLPRPVKTVLREVSSATQIVADGPLPMADSTGTVLLATNLHGQSPYFTASLESAIQAGALAAERLDGTVELLPMGPANVLPWEARAEAAAALVPVPATD